MEWIKEIGRLLIILALQVLLFDHLHIGIWGFPMGYVFFLITLSPRIPRWAEMCIGFAIGMCMDICHSSLGIHTAACVAITYLRPIILTNIVQEIERVKNHISSQSIGRIEYAKCAILLTFIHHFIVFALEAWNWQHWWIIILQTIISTLLTLIIVIGYDRIKQ